MVVVPEYLVTLMRFWLIGISCCMFLPGFCRTLCAATSAEFVTVNEGQSAIRTILHHDAPTLLVYLSFADKIKAFSNYSGAKHLNKCSRVFCISHSGCSCIQTTPDGRKDNERQQ